MIEKMVSGTEKTSTQVEKKGLQDSVSPPKSPLRNGISRNRSLKVPTDL
jgi:hypothetical protein